MLRAAQMMMATAFSRHYLGAGQILLHLLIYIRHPSVITINFTHHLSPKILRDVNYVFVLTFTGWRLSDDISIRRSNIDYINVTNILILIY